MMFRRILAAALAVFVFCAASPAARAQVIPAQSATVLAGAKKDLYPRAVMALDFAGVGTGGTPWYKAGGAISTLPSTLRGYTFTRALAAYAEDIEGKLTLFPAGSPRVTNKGVLIEPPATNLLAQSNALSTSPWVAVSGTVTANAGIAPDGTNTANGLASATYYQPSVLPNGTSTFSIYAKANGASQITLKADVSGNGRQVVFDLSTGVAAASTTLGTGGTVSSMTGSMTPAGFGYYRCVVVIVTTGINNPSYITTGNVLAWGGQVETGSVASSYIPTTTGSVTRPLDNYLFTGVTPGSGVTLVALVSSSHVPVGNEFPASLDDGTGSNRIQIFHGPASTDLMQPRVVTGGASGHPNSIANGLLNFGTSNVALATTASRSMAAANGTLSPIAGSPSGMPPFTMLHVGANEGGSAWGGYIQRILVYPFAMTDAELQAATMPGETSALRLDFARGAYKNAAGYLRTNWVRNSSIVGAAAGTPGTVPTGWVANVITPGLSSSVVGTGTEDGRKYLDWRVFGTATNTTSSSIWFGALTDTPASAGQNWTASVYVKLVGGSLANVSNVFVLGGVSTNGTSISATFGTASFTPTSTATRYWASGTTGASTVNVLNYLQINPAVGAVDLTLRIYQPQLEQTNYPTSDIQTSGAAASVTTYSSTNPADVANMTFTRASTGYAEDAAGNLVLFGSNVPRITNKGVLIEPAATNSIRNSTPGNGTTVGVVGSGGVVGTNWSVSASGPTVTVLGTGAEGSLPYVDVRVAGTSSVAEIALLFEGSAAMAAASGQTWTYSQYMSLVGGDLTNITAVQLVLYERNNVGSAVANTTLGVSLGTTRSRPFVTRALNQATTAFVSQKLILVPVVGQPVDFTLRIFPPQMEQGSVPTSYIPTTSVAVTRPADAFSYTGLSSSSGSIVAAAAPSPGAWSTSAGSNAVFALRAGAAGDARVILFKTSTANTSRFEIYDSAAARIFGFGDNTIAGDGSASTWAIRYASNDMRHAFGGVLGSLDNTGTPSLMTDLYLGSLSTAGANALAGYLQRVALYPYAANDNELPYRSAGNF